MPSMRLMTVKIPETYHRMLDKLVKLGRFRSKSEAVRFAIKMLIEREGIPWEDGEV